MALKTTTGPEAVPAPKRNRGQKDRKKALPLLPAYPPFEFLANPDVWTIHASGKVVPQLRQLKQAPGVQGATQNEDRSVDLDGPLYNAKRDGYVELPEDLGGEPYCLGYQTRGGLTYLPRWLTPIPGSKVRNYDADAELAFLDLVVEFLTKEGHIDGGPPLHILDALVAGAAARVDTAKDKVAKKPGHARTLAVLEKQLAEATKQRDAARAKVEADDGKVEATPAPKGTKGRK